MCDVKLYFADSKYRFFSARVPLDLVTRDVAKEIPAKVYYDMSCNMENAAVSYGMCLDPAMTALVTAATMMAPLTRPLVRWRRRRQFVSF